VPFAVWMTGLPGSGKSTIAKELLNQLDNTEYLRLDAIRKKYVQQPKFTDEERELVYSKFAEEGAELIKQGKNVLFDATAYRRIWRDNARSQIKDFLEVYVKCPIEKCAEREGSRGEGLVMADMYRKALERQRTGKQFEGLGSVVGIDVPFEENSDVEMIIDSDKISPKEAAKAVLDQLKKKGWI